MIAAGGEIDALPIGGQHREQVGIRQILDENAEQTLVEFLREVQFLNAPDRFQPVATDQKQHRLAAICRLVQSPLPTPASGDAAFGIEIEEGMLVPPVGNDPFLQSDGRRVILARMAEKYSRHSSACLL